MNNSWENDEQKDLIRSDHNLLLQVKSGSKSHHNTKFHCMGQPFFDDEEEGEDEWATRFYYSVKDYIPDGITAIPLFQYSRRFNKFQELVSGTQKENFFYFELCQTCCLRELIEQYHPAYILVVKC